MNWEICMLLRMQPHYPDPALTISEFMIHNWIRTSGHLSSATQHASSTECQLFWCVSVTWYVINSSWISSLKPIGNVSWVKCKCWHSNLQVGNGHANPWTRPQIHMILCFPLTKAINPPRSSKMWNRPHPLICRGGAGGVETWDSAHTLSIVEFLILVSSNPIQALQEQPPIPSAYSLPN